MEISTGIAKHRDDILLNRVVLLCVFATVSLGIFVLFGWVLGFNNMNSFGKNYVPMAEETALLFLIFGIALAFSSKMKSGRNSLLYLRGSALFVGVVIFLLLNLLYMCKFFVCVCNICVVDFKPCYLVNQKSFLQHDKCLWVVSISPV